MLRKSPINYLLSVAMVLAAWALGVLWGAAYLGDSVSFQDVTPDEFQWTYRLVLTGLALAVIVMTALWFALGARDSTATQLISAKRTWISYWLVLFALSIAAVIALVIVHLGEIFEPIHYVVMFLTTASLTWIVFWAATLLCSPPIVEFVPWGKR